jgi:cell division septal protein FtsQ
VPKYNSRNRRRAVKGDAIPDDNTRRLRRRVRWRRLFVTLCLLAAAAGAIVLYRSPLLRVQEVEVVGATNTSAERIQELAGLEGDSMLNPGTTEASRKIADLPLVRAVSIDLRWPNKARINVLERQPWGYWRLNDTDYVIDDEGTIMADVTPPEGAPIIHDLGPPTPPLSPGEQVDGDAVRLASALLKFVPDELALAVARFEYTPERGLSLQTNADYRVVVGDSQNVDYKLAVWRAVEEEIGRPAMAGHVLDLRFQDRPSFQ